VDTSNVQPGTPPGYCGAIAHELRRIADALGEVEHLELPEPRYVHLHIQPGGKTDDDVIDAVNALGLAVNGQPGKPVKMSGGSYHFVTEVHGRPVSFNAYREISRDCAWRMDPDYQPDERDRELARLRADSKRLEYFELLDQFVERGGIAAGARDLAARGEYGAAIDWLRAAEPKPAHPSWPTEQELKPWESLAPAADRLAESVKPIDPDASMEAHYEAEAADPTGLNYTRADDGTDPQPSAGRVDPRYVDVVDAPVALVPLLNVPMRDEHPRTVNEVDDSLSTPGETVYAPCQPIGCDNGFHLTGCVYAGSDR
jgi:hypothetical protein